MKAKLAIFFCYVLLTNSASAQSQFSTDGIGKISCSQWSSDRTTQNGSQQELTKGLADLFLGDEEAWIMGFLSGSASAYSVILHKNAIYSGDLKTILHQIDAYCQANPNEDLATAAGAFFATHYAIN